MPPGSGVEPVPSNEKLLLETHPLPVAVKAATGPGPAAITAEI